MLLGNFAYNLDFFRGLFSPGMLVAKNGGL